MLSRGCLVVSFTFWDFGGWTCLGLLENAGPFTTLAPSACHLILFLFSILILGGIWCWFPSAGRVLSLASEACTDGYDSDCQVAARKGKEC